VEITEVRIKLMADPHERLLAFCSVTFDQCFVIRDLKIIQGTKGAFVAMPSRKLTDRCPQCNMKNHLRSTYCNQCGAQLCDDRAIQGDDGRSKLYADIAHPINSSCREMIQSRVVEAYGQEQVLAKEPGYICRYDDYDEDRYAELADDPPAIAGRIEPAADTPPPPHLGQAAAEAESIERPEGESPDFGAGVL
jgi:stage V sporulation protein G